MWLIYSTISALLSATAAIGEKKALIKDKALNFSVILAILNFLLCVPFISSNNQIIFSALFLIYIKSILTTIAFLLIMIGLKNLQISNSLPLLIFTPFFVALGDFLFFGDILKGIEYLGMIFIIFGAYLLQLKNIKKPLRPFKEMKDKDYLYMFGAVLIFTVSSLMDKQLIVKQKVPPFQYLSLSLMFTALNFILIFAIKERRIKLKKIINGSLGLIIGISIITLGYRYLHILAIKEGDLPLVLSIKRFSIFFAAIIGGNIFDEEHLIKKSLAIILMLIGASIMVLNEKSFSFLKIYLK